MDPQDPPQPPALEQTKVHPPSLGPPSGIPPNELNLAMWCHLIPVLSWFIFGPLGFIGPLLIMTNRQPPSSYINYHAKEAINAQISIMIYGVAITIFGMITCGLGILLLIPGLVIFFIFGIMATIAATRGEYHRYPLCIRFVK